ncbi:hypothetical protein [Streptomyces pseudogriseolus]|uniref:hypothetical protein n=1 Tax=Streptomyces pseudogriseolus TaxID=36817 RepID=UPI003491C78D
MTLAEGEYEFTCDECDGDGSLQVVQPPEDEDDEPTLVWERCDDCRGESRLLVDDKETAEKIRWGQTPTRAPAG